MCSWYSGWYCAIFGHAWGSVMCRYGQKAGTVWYQCNRCCQIQGDPTCGGYA